MDLPLLARLTSGEGWGLLQSLPPYDEGSALSLAVQLRDAGFDPDLVAAAMTQSQLRARAVDKLGPHAREMLLTRDGLEQATRREIADLHAERFKAAGVEHIYDLGCGIGSDAIGFARSGLAVTAVDADDVTAAIADVNLRPWTRANAEHARAEDVAIPSGEAGRSIGVWLDPARRTPGVADIHGRTRRVFRLEDISPPWDTVRALGSRAHAAGAKLSPSFPHGQVPPGAEAQWTSYDGEVVECTLWWGSLVKHAGRTARVLGKRVDSTLTEADAKGADTRSAQLGRMGPYLYEPDRAVLRAGLVGALTNTVDGLELAPGVGYVTGLREVRLPWAKRYAITEAIPFNIKAIRALLRDRQVGRITLKKRGVSLDADQFRRQLRLSGDREVTMVVTRAGDAQVAMIVTPI